tara:strand:+ start:100590 stop:103898 length:3309 start_codon:yes stop_codon:yes gene_type:complete
MVFIKKIIISIFLLFSVSVFAQTANTVPPVDPEKCGLNEDGKIERISYDICQEDIAFRSLYDIFPSFFDNYVFKIMEFKYISDIQNNNLSPTNETNKYMYTNIFESIFSTLSEISLIFILLVVLYHLIVGIIKGIDSGTFLVEEKERKNVYGLYLLGVFLSLPIGNLLIIHIVLLLIFILSIIPANLIFTYFLTGVLSGFSPNIEYNVDSENNPNYVNSNIILDEFTKSKICKFNSANYLLRNRVDDSNFNTDYDKYKSCFVPSNDIALENDANNENIEQSPFLTYRAEKIKENEVNYSSSLIMGKLNAPKNCELENIQNFKCSTIKITNVNEEDNYIISDIIGYKNYKNSVKSLVPELSYPNSGNKNKIKSEFKNLKLLVEEFDYENNSDIKQPNVSDLQHFSYLFHKDVMNSITIGLVEYKTLVSNNPKNTILFKKNDFAGLIQNYAITLSHLLKKIDCLKNFELLEGTNNLIDGLKKNKMTTCLNPNNNSLFVEYINPKEEPQKYEEKYKELIKEYREKKERYLEDITKNRTYVLQSFDESIIDISNDFASSYNLGQKSENEEGFNPDSRGKNLKDIRKEGFMGYAGLITKTALISSNIPQYRNDLIKNFSIVPNYNTKLISQTVFDDGYEFNSDFNDILIESKILKETPEKVKLNSTSRPEPKFDSERDFDFFFLMDMFKPIKNSFNINEILKPENGYRDLCIEQPEKCPVPKINPISTINMLGSTYFEQGLFLVGLGISTGITASTLNYFNNKSKLKNSDSAGVKQKRTILRKTKTVSGKVMDVIYMFIGFITLIGLFCLLAGFLMMVAIPLLPFIYMLTSFIEWLILFLSTLVISPIFVSYLFNYNENQQEIKEFLKNSILKIFIKPTLLILSMLFLYAFFYVVIFFINITLFSYLESATVSNNMLKGFIANFIYAFMYAFVVFVLLKWLFNTIDNFNDKTFNLLGVQTSGNQNNQNNSLIQDLVILSAYQNLSQKIMDSPNFITQRPNILHKRDILRNQLENRRYAYERIVNGEYDQTERIFQYRKDLGDGNFKNDTINLDELKNKGFNEREDLYFSIIKSDPETYGKYHSSNDKGIFKNVPDYFKNKFANKGKE